ncbi:ZIP family metal transporter [Spirochaetota bacterium]
MNNAGTYAIISVITISLVSVLAAVPLLIRKTVPQKTLVVLLSLSVGTLLGSVFIHFIPEAMKNGYNLKTAIFFLIGFVSFLILEKFIHWRHNDCQDDERGHSHAYHLAPINLIGDGVHNFLDGLVIAGAFIVDINLGIAASISIMIHEIPQEIADFGILLYSGLSKLRALLFNFLSAATAILGAVIGIVLSGQIEGFTQFIIPFAAGNFIYIAAANLTPELHRHCKFWDSIIHVIAIFAGIGIMIAVAIFSPGHSH